MTEPIISVSGLRGIVGETLTPEVAIRYAAAFAAVAPPGPIVLARDSRPSGRMLAGAINSGLEAVGRSTINAGIAATPTTGVLVRHLRRGRRDSDHGQPQPVALQRPEAVFRRRARHSRRPGRKGPAAIPHRPPRLGCARRLGNRRVADRHAIGPSGAGPGDGPAGADSPAALPRALGLQSRRRRPAGTASAGGTRLHA